MLDRFRLLCPACSYDVGPSLQAGINVCSECGEPVSYEACSRVVENIPRGPRRLVMMSWIVPPATFVVAFVANCSWFVGGTLTAMSVLPVYAAWMYAEHWTGRRRPWLSAIPLTIAILVLDAWLVLAILLGAMLVWPPD